MNKSTHIPAEPQLTFELEEFRRAEDSAIEFNKTHYSNHYLLAEEMASLYRGLIFHMSESQAEKREGIPEASIFMLGTAHYYVLGALTLFRSHVSDSNFYTRKAIELTAFARAIVVDPSRFEAWKNAVKSDKYYREYKRLFRNDVLFGRGGTLYELYDRSSRLAHSSAAPLEAHWDSGTTITGSVVTWDVFSQGVDIGQEVIELLSVHVELLKVHQELFEHRLSHAKLVWEQQMKVFCERVNQLN